MMKIMKKTGITFLVTAILGALTLFLTGSGKGMKDKLRRTDIGKKSTEETLFV